MSDYGFRISKNGVDVKTGSDKDMVLTSKYSTLKGNINGSGTAAFTEGSEHTVTIAHGLGYIPSVFFLVEMYGGGEYYPTPLFDSGGLYTEYYYAYADATNVYLKFFADYYGSSTVYISYSYKIKIDKGKV